MTAPADDIDRIMAVMGCAFAPEFGEAWTRRQIEDALIGGRCHYGIVGAEGTIPSPPGAEPAGFFLSRHGVEEEELLLLAVSPKYRRHGLGRILLAYFAGGAAARGAARLLLEMRDGNPAQSLYAARGFVPIGRRRDYYRTASGARIDAITFACPV